NNDHGIYASPSSYGLIANNVIEHNDSKGLMARHDANHLVIVNNTIVGNGRYGIDINESAHDWLLANNILLNNGTIKGGGGISTRIRPRTISCRRGVPRLVSQIPPMRCRSTLPASVATRHPTPARTSARSSRILRAARVGPGAPPGEVGPFRPAMLRT